MFAFVMLWAYFNVSQLIIIWSGNLPEEIPFYLQRLHGPWAPISIALLLGQFALPFLLLLSRRSEARSTAVRWIALLILVDARRRHRRGRSGRSSGTTASTSARGWTSRWCSAWAARG